MTTLAFTPMILLTASAIVSKMAGDRSIRLRNAVISSSFAIATLINTYFLITSLSGAFDYAELGELTTNAASICISELVLTLGFLGVIYSFGYVEERAETWAYYLLYQLFTALMIGMASSFNILVVYIFLEASSVASAVLVMFSRRRSSILAAYRYLALSIFGGLIILSAIFYQYQLANTLDLAVLSRLDQAEVNILSTLYLLGFGIKAGLLPFGLLWLPPAHSEAPIPIHTLLSAALVQVAAFDIARILGSAAITNSYIASLLLIVGLTSMLTGCTYALVESWFGSRYTRFHVGCRDIRGIKRVWAFSTISEVGYVSMFLGSAGMLASNGFGYEEAVVFGFGGAMLHMYNHGLAKSQLLFDSGVMIKVAHAEDLDLMGGLSTRLPSMRISFIVGALSLGLMPGTLGFTTLREVVFNSSIPHVTRIVAIATAGISLAACLSVWSQAFFSKVEHDLEDHMSVPRIMYLPGFVAGAAIIVFGIYFTLDWIGLASLDPRLTSALRTIAETTIRTEANF